MPVGDSVRIIPHSPVGIPDTGSFEVQYPGGKEFFYWDNNPGRRSISRSVNMDRDHALEAAKAFARSKISPD